MDTQLAIASMRDTRRYRVGEFPEGALKRVLLAGRIAGSGKNRQLRRFVVIRECRDEAAERVTRPTNVRNTPVSIAIVSADSSFAGFDVGRAAQNMMLAAWDEGVASCPNAIADQEGMDLLLGASEGEHVWILISFGYPSSGKDPGLKSAEEWHRGADRLPLEELVERR